MKKSKRNLLRMVYDSNIFAAILLVVLVFSIVKVSKELTRRHQINEEISNLKQEMTDAQLKRDKLQDLISYLETDQYIEEQARLQLNLSKPGENRIDLSDNPQPIAAVVKEDENLSNWQKWFNYFFK